MFHAPSGHPFTVVSAEPASLAWAKWRLDDADRNGTIEIVQEIVRLTDLLALNAAVEPAGDVMLRLVPISSARPGW